MLSESDAKVLKAISAGDADPQTIADKLGMKIEAVRASADALGESGMVQVAKSVQEIFSLTEEGRRYAQEGLPERKLLQAIGPGMPMSDLKEPSAKIALGWLKKKGWAAIDKGVLKPTGVAEQGRDEEMLDILLEGSRNAADLDRDALAQLKARGLVSSTATKSWKYQATAEGRKASSELGETVAETVSEATPAMIKFGEWEGNCVRLEGRLYQVRPYDVTLAADRIYPGKKHPYQRLIDHMRQIMLEMGFSEIKGQIVQSSFWNFDALFQPQDHPAREMQDTFCPVPAPGPPGPGDAGHLLPGQPGRDSRLRQSQGDAPVRRNHWLNRLGRGLEPGGGPAGSLEDSYHCGDHKIPG